MTIRLSSNREEKIKALISKAIYSEKRTIRFVSSLLGSLISALPAIPMGRLYSRNIETQKNAELAKNGGNYEALMKISNEMKDELLWWSSHLNAERNINTPSRHETVEFMTDASKSGNFQLSKN